MRLFRPWDSSRFLAALPKMTERICVLDRTKEPGSQGEPLLLEVASTLHASAHSEIVVVGGRYGLGSKEFTPNQVRAPKTEFKRGRAIVRMCFILFCCLVS